MPEAELDECVSVFVSAEDERWHTEERCKNSKSANQIVARGSPVGCSAITVQNGEPRIKTKKTHPITITGVY